MTYPQLPSAKPQSAGRPKSKTDSTSEGKCIAHSHRWLDCRLLPEACNCYPMLECLGQRCLQWPRLDKRQEVDKPMRSRISRPHDGTTAPRRSAKGLRQFLDVEQQRRWIAGEAALRDA